MHKPLPWREVNSKINVYLCWCMFVNNNYRIGYAVFLMERLKSRFPNHQIHLLYDVACTLERHLQVLNAYQLTMCNV